MSKFLKILEKNNIQKQPFDVFVETGLYDGGTIKSLHDSGFFKEIKKVYSIEIVESFIEKFYLNNPHLDYINLINGDSSVEIDNIVEKHINDKFLFWLDGHFSGGNTGKSELSGECPLLFELDSIRKCKNPVVVIDDIGCCFLDEYYKNWPKLENVIDKLISVKKDFKIVIEIPESYVNERFKQIQFQDNVTINYNPSYNYLLAY